MLKLKLTAKVSTIDAVPLEPALEQATDIPPLAEGGYRKLTLTANVDGSLWVFSDASDGLRVQRYDADGQITAESLVEAPSDLETPSDQPVVYSFGNATASSPGPLLSLDWNRACESTKTEKIGDGLSFFSCVTTELLAFGETVDDAPQRFRPFTERPGFQTPNQQVFRDPAGNLLAVSVPGSAAKLDRKGRKVWVQPAFSKSGSSGVSMGGFLPSGDLVLALESRLALDDEYTWPELFRIDAQGNVAYHAKVERFSEVGIDERLIPPFASLTISSLVDTQGRWTIVSNLESGDLDVVRVDEDRDLLEGVRFIREEHVHLYVNGVTVDTEGTVYVTTPAGPRNSAKQLLCRVPVEGTPGCFQIPDGVEHLQSVGANTVHALRTRDQALVRFDFPSE